MGKFNSKIILKNLIDGFSIDHVDSNQKYLEFQLERLDKVVSTYKLNSRNSKLPPRIRARNRDLEQNTLGLINGIKFAISFMMSKDINLIKEEKLDYILKDGNNGNNTSQ